MVSYLIFIKLHASSSKDYSDDAVPILTSRGLLCPTNDSVHFSEEYGNINLPERLPGTEMHTRTHTRTHVRTHTVCKQVDAVLILTANSDLVLVF